MLFLIDNTIDPKNRKYFTELIDFLEKLNNFRYISISNEEMLEYYSSLFEPSCFILSGSPLQFIETDINEYAEQFDLNLNIIKKYGTKIPILGICFGAQLINLHFGGELVRIEKTICKDIERYRFCLNYLISKLGNNLESILQLKNLGTIFFKHKYYPIYGCLFHPEYHEDTHSFIRNFLFNFNNEMYS